MTKANLLDFFKDKNILITGGLGFIGSNLVHRLIDFNAKVTIIDALIPEYGGNLFNIAGIEDRVRVNISDVRDSKIICDLVKGQEILFNLVGQTSHLDSMADPFTDLEMNCRAQLSILEACRKCNPDIKIVFTSTRQIYGKPDYLPVDEKHPLKPVDVNGINKMAGEWYHMLYNNVYGIKTAVLRLTNTYGPRMRIKDSRQTFVGIWIRYLLEGRAFEIWGGQQLRDFTYVDDVVEALLLTAMQDTANGRIFNLGGECIISLKDLAKLLSSINGGGEYKVLSFPSERKKIDIGDYYSDFKQIKTALGWEPKVSLREGLTYTISFYRKYLHNYL